MMKMYKIVSGMYDIAATPYLQPCKQNVTRGHSLKLAKSYSDIPSSSIYVYVMFIQT